MTKKITILRVKRVLKKKKLREAFNLKASQSRGRKVLLRKELHFFSKLIGYQQQDPSDSLPHESERESVRKSTKNNKHSQKDDTSDDESNNTKEDRGSVVSKSDIGPKLGFVRKVLNYEEFQVSAFAPGTQDQPGMYIATWKLFDLPVVLVEVQDELFTSSFRRRIKKLRKVPAHPNILRCFGYCTKTNGKPSIVYEFVSQAPLMTHKANLTLKEKLFVVMCIARGMWQLHRSKVVHGSLSVGNVLIDTLRNPKLSEYGLPSSVAESKKKIDINRGKQEDVFDFGKLITELFVTTAEQNNNNVLISSTASANDQEFPKELHYLLSLCLNQDPTARPTFYRIQNSLENFYYSTWKFSTYNPLVLDVLPSSLNHEEQLKQREDQILKLMLKVKALEEAISHTNNNNSALMNISSSDLRKHTFPKPESPILQKKDTFAEIPKEPAKESTKEKESKEKAKETAKDKPEPKPTESNDNNAPQTSSPRGKEGIFANFGNLLFNAKTIRGTIAENDSKQPEDASAMNPAQLQLEVSARFRGALKIDWIDFCIILKELLGVEQEQLNEVKYLLCDKKSKVDKAVWEHMMKWFSPLYPEMSRPDNTKAYTFSDVVDIVGQKWFFGFIDPIETNKILATKPTGTFLFRFSSQPGCYTLSVANAGQVGHWRIRSERGPDFEQYFIDERQYTSLANVIEVHVNEPLKINTAKSNQRPLRLEVPYERPSTEENDRDHIYSEF
mmetsp:Transcript_1000/g.1366  ORF Transcript_1000/g.1366 Transcript_1000/m.1366 type:complete len:729 (+) Transcript_1000:75-2261(+)